MTQATTASMRTIASIYDVATTLLAALFHEQARRPLPMARALLPKDQRWRLPR